MASRVKTIKKEIVVADSSDDDEVLVKPLKTPKMESKDSSSSSPIMSIPEGKLLTVRDYGKQPTKSGKKKTGKTGKVSLPPMIQLTPIVKHVFRFRVTSTVNGTNVGVGGILGALGNIASATTTLRNLATAFRIHSVKLWLPGGSTGINSYIDWSNSATFGISPDYAIDKTTPDGITDTGVLVFKPPAKSLAGYWLANSISGGSGVFAVTALAGSILDLEVSYCLANVYGTSSVTITGPATVGNMYYLALNGPATNTIQPVGLTTIF
jgi:hypothetical protein